MSGANSAACANGHTCDASLPAGATADAHDCETKPDTVAYSCAVGNCAGALAGNNCAAAGATCLCTNNNQCGSGHCLAVSGNNSAACGASCDASLPTGASTDAHDCETIPDAINAYACIIGKCAGPSATTGPAVADCSAANQPCLCTNNNQCGSGHCLAVSGNNSAACGVNCDASLPTGATADSHDCETLPDSVATYTCSIGNCGGTLGTNNCSAAAQTCYCTNDNQCGSGKCSKITSGANQNSVACGASCNGTTTAGTFDGHNCQTIPDVAAYSCQAGSACNNDTASTNVCSGTTHCVCSLDSQCKSGKCAWVTGVGGNNVACGVVGNCNAGADPGAAGRDGFDCVLTATAIPAAATSLGYTSFGYAPANFTATSAAYTGVMPASALTITSACTYVSHTGTWTCSQTPAPGIVKDVLQAPTSAFNGTFKCTSGSTTVTLGTSQQLAVGTSVATSAGVFLGTISGGCTASAGTSCTFAATGTAGCTGAFVAGDIYSVGPPVDVLVFAGLTISTGSLTLSGANPVVLAVYGNASISGTLKANGGAAAAGPGANNAAYCGTGPGGSSQGGGGGGARFTAGGGGGAGFGGTTAGGTPKPSGNQGVPLLGGCAGGLGNGSSSATVGGGGGGLQISVAGALTVSGAGITANGGAGGNDSGGGGGGGSGGGSGGDIVLEAASTTNTATITATGGKGGGSFGNSNGGNGGIYSVANGGAASTSAAGNGVTNTNAGTGGGGGEGYVLLHSTNTAGSAAYSCASSTLAIKPVPNSSGTPPPCICVDNSDCSNGLCVPNVNAPDECSGHTCSGSGADSTGCQQTIAATLLSYSCPANSACPNNAGVTASSCPASTTLCYCHNDNDCNTRTGGSGGKCAYITAGTTGNSFACGSQTAGTGCSGGSNPAAGTYDGFYCMLATGTTEVKNQDAIATYSCPANSACANDTSTGATSACATSAALCYCHSDNDCIARVGAGAKCGYVTGIWGAGNPANSVACGSTTAGTGCSGGSVLANLDAFNCTLGGGASEVRSTDAVASYSCPANSGCGNDTSTGTTAACATSAALCYCRSNADCVARLGAGATCGLVTGIWSAGNPANSVGCGGSSVTCSGGSTLANLDAFDCALATGASGVKINDGISAYACPANSACPNDGTSTTSACPLGTTLCYCSQDSDCNNRTGGTSGKCAYVAGNNTGNTVACNAHGAGGSNCNSGVDPGAANRDAFYCALGTGSKEVANQDAASYSCPANSACANDTSTGTTSACATSAAICYCHNDNDCIARVGAGAKCGYVTGIWGAGNPANSVACGSTTAGTGCSGGSVLANLDAFDCVLGSGAAEVNNQDAIATYSCPANSGCGNDTTTGTTASCANNAALCYCRSDADCVARVGAGARCGLVTGIWSAGNPANSVGCGGSSATCSGGSTLANLDAFDCLLGSGAAEIRSQDAPASYSCPASSACPNDSTSATSSCPLSTTLCYCHSDADCNTRTGGSSGKCAYVAGNNTGNTVACAAPANCNGGVDPGAANRDPFYCVLGTGTKEVYKQDAPATFSCPANSACANDTSTGTTSACATSAAICYCHNDNDCIARVGAGAKCGYVTGIWGAGNPANSVACGSTTAGTGCSGGSVLANLDAFNCTLGGGAAEVKSQDAISTYSCPANSACPNDGTSATSSCPLSTTLCYCHSDNDCNARTGGSGGKCAYFTANNTGNSVACGSQTAGTGCSGGLNPAAGTYDNFYCMLATGTKEVNNQDSGAYSCAKGNCVGNCTATNQTCVCQQNSDCLGAGGAGTGKCMSTTACTGTCYTPAAGDVFDGFNCLLAAPSSGGQTSYLPATSYCAGATPSVSATNTCVCAADAQCTSGKCVPDPATTKNNNCSGAGGASCTGVADGVAGNEDSNSCWAPLSQTNVPSCPNGGCNTATGNCTANLQTCYCTDDTQCLGAGLCVQVSGKNEISCAANTCSGAGAHDGFGCTLGVGGEVSAPACLVGTPSLSVLATCAATASTQCASGTCVRTAGNSNNAACASSGTADNNSCLKPVDSLGNTCSAGGCNASGGGCAAAGAGCYCTKDSQCLTGSKCVKITGQNNTSCGSGSGNCSGGSYASVAAANTAGVKLDGFDCSLAGAVTVSSAPACGVGTPSQTYANTCAATNNSQCASGSCVKSAAGTGNNNAAGCTGSGTTDNNTCVQPVDVAGNSCPTGGCNVAGGQCASAGAGCFCTNDSECLSGSKCSKITGTNDTACGSNCTGTAYASLAAATASLLVDGFGCALGGGTEVAIPTCTPGTPSLSTVATCAATAPGQCASGTCARTAGNNNNAACTASGGYSGTVDGYSCVVPYDVSGNSCPTGGCNAIGGGCAVAGTTCYCNNDSECLSGSKCSKITGANDVACGSNCTGTAYASAAAATASKLVDGFGCALGGGTEVAASEVCAVGTPSLSTTAPFAAATCVANDDRAGTDQCASGSCVSNAANGSSANCHGSGTTDGADCLQITSAVAYSCAVGGCNAAAGACASSGATCYCFNDSQCLSGVCVNDGANNNTSCTGTGGSCSGVAATAHDGFDCALASPGIPPVTNNTTYSCAVGAACNAAHTACLCTADSECSSGKCVNAAGQCTGACTGAGGSVDAADCQVIAPVPATWFCSSGGYTCALGGCNTSGGGCTAVNQGCYCYNNSQCASGACVNDGVNNNASCAGTGGSCVAAGPAHDGFNCALTSPGIPAYCGFGYTPSNFTPASYTPPSGATTDCNATYSSTSHSFTTGSCTGAAPTIVSSVAQTGGSGPPVDILVFKTLTIASTSTLRLVGANPVILAVYGDATIAGTISASGVTGTNGSSSYSKSSLPPSTTPGAGGNQNCGAADTSALTTSTGGNAFWTGNSYSGGDLSGGGGGGGRVAGANGGTSQFSGDFGYRGIARGNTGAPLLGGCNGGYSGFSCTAGGGAAGGAVQISAAGTLTLTGGTINTSGGAGGAGINSCSYQPSGGGGGGSAGDIVVEGTTVTGGTLTANGGNGGADGANDSGGAGGKSSTSTAPAAGNGNSYQSASGGGGGYGYVKTSTGVAALTCSTSTSLSPAPVCNSAHTACLCAADADCPSGKCSNANAQCTGTCSGTTTAGTYDSVDCQLLTDKAANLPNPGPSPAANTQCWCTKDSQCKGGKCVTWSGCTGAGPCTGSGTADSFNCQVTGAEIANACTASYSCTTTLTPTPVPNAGNTACVCVDDGDCPSGKCSNVSSNCTGTCTGTTTAGTYDAAYCQKVTDAVNATTYACSKGSCNAPKGLLAYYPFDGDTTDHSGDGYNADAETGVEVSYAAGHSGQAATILGTGNGIQATGAVSTARTLCAWVKPNAGTTGGGLPVFVGGTSGAADMFDIMSATAGGGCAGQGAAANQLFIDNWGSACRTTTLTVTPGSWNFVCFAYDGASSTTFFANGASQTVAGGDFSYTLSQITIGADRVGGSTTAALFAGAIDEVSIWSTTLTTGQMNGLYNAGTGTTPICTAASQGCYCTQNADCGAGSTCGYVTSGANANSAACGSAAVCTGGTTGLDSFDCTPTITSPTCSVGTPSRTTANLCAATANAQCSSGLCVSNATNANAAGCTGTGAADSEDCRIGDGTQPVATDLTCNPNGATYSCAKGGCNTSTPTAGTCTASGVQCFCIKDADCSSSHCVAVAGQNDVSCAAGAGCTGSPAAVRDGFDCDPSAPVCSLGMPIATAPYSTCACTADTQCASGTCVQSAANNNCVGAGPCSASGLAADAQSCLSLTADVGTGVVYGCLTGNCTGGTCTGLNQNCYCTQDSQCKSGKCVPGANNNTCSLVNEGPCTGAGPTDGFNCALVAPGIPPLASANATTYLCATGACNAGHTACSCTADSQCTSGKCVNAASQCTGACSGSGAADAESCQFLVSSSSGSGFTCAKGGCDAAGGTCAASGTCYCTNDNQCTSGKCVNTSGKNELSCTACTGAGPNVDGFNCQLVANGIPATPTAATGYTCAKGGCNTAGGACSAAGTCYCTSDAQCNSGKCLKVSGQNDVSCGANCTGAGAADGFDCVLASPGIPATCAAPTFGYTPSNFAPGTYTPPATSTTINCNTTYNSSTHAFTGWCAGQTAPTIYSNVAQAGGPSVDILAFRALTLNPGNTLTLTSSGGGNAVIFAVYGDANIQGTILANGANGVKNSTTVGASGPGGNYSCGGSAGSAPGSTNNAGGGGGGGSGAGGAGGNDSSGGAGGTKGSARANASIVPLYGGCPGGNSGNCGQTQSGGGGGGAVQISAAGALSVTGTISAQGGAGGSGTSGQGCGSSTWGGGAGGGSGGAVLLEGNTAPSAGTVNGGAGGATGGNAVVGSGGTSGTPTGGNGTTDTNNVSKGGAGGGGGYGYLKTNTGAAPVYGCTTTLSPAPICSGAHTACLCVADADCPSGLCVNAAQNQCAGHGPCTGSGTADAASCQVLSTTSSSATYSCTTTLSPTPVPNVADTACLCVADGDCSSGKCVNGPTSQCTGTCTGVGSGTSYSCAKGGCNGAGGACTATAQTCSCTADSQCNSGACVKVTGKNDVSCTSCSGSGIADGFSCQLVANGIPATPTSSTAYSCAKGGCNAASGTCTASGTCYCTADGQCNSGKCVKTTGQNDVSCSGCTGSGAADGFDCLLASPGIPPVTQLSYSAFGYTPSNFTASSSTYTSVMPASALTITSACTYVSNTGTWTCAQTPAPGIVKNVAQTSGGPNVDVLVFNGLTISSGGSLTLSGANPVILAVYGNASISGILRADGGASAGPGGNNAAYCGTGPNGGSQAGGGGGARYTAGGGGAQGFGGTTAGGAPTPSGNQGAPLLGGCAGGSGNGGGGGGNGGGGLQISVAGTLTVSGTGMTANGGAGSNGGYGGGGGAGSGGDIVLEAASTSNTATITANGGAGGGTSNAIGGSGGIYSVANGGAASTSAATAGAYDNTFVCGGGGGGGEGYVLIHSSGTASPSSHFCTTSLTPAPVLNTANTACLCVADTDCPSGKCIKVADNTTGCTANGCTGTGTADVASCQVLTTTSTTTASCVTTLSPKPVPNGPQTACSCVADSDCPSGKCVNAGSQCTGTCTGSGATDQADCQVLSDVAGGGSGDVASCQPLPTTGSAGTYACPKGGCNAAAGACSAASQACYCTKDADCGGGEKCGYVTSGANANSVACGSAATCTGGATGLDGFNCVLGTPNLPNACTTQSGSTCATGVMNAANTACICNGDSECMSSACISSASNNNCAAVKGVGGHCTGTGAPDSFGCQQEVPTISSFYCATGTTNAAHTLCLCSSDNQCESGKCVKTVGQNDLACGSGCTGTGTPDAYNCQAPPAPTNVYACVVGTTNSAAPPTACLCANDTHCPGGRKCVPVSGQNAAACGGNCSGTGAADSADCTIPTPTIASYACTVGIPDSTHSECLCTSDNQCPDRGAPIHSKCVPITGQNDVACGTNCNGLGAHDIDGCEIPQPQVSGYSCASTVSPSSTPNTGNTACMCTADVQCKAGRLCVDTLDANQHPKCLVGGCTGSGTPDSDGCAVPVASVFSYMCVAGTPNVPGLSPTACFCTDDSQCPNRKCHWISGHNDVCTSAGHTCTGGPSIDSDACEIPVRTVVSYACTPGAPDAGGTVCLCTDDNQCAGRQCVPTAGQCAAGACTGSGAADSDSCALPAKTVSGSACLHGVPNSNSTACICSDDGMCPSGQCELATPPQCSGLLGSVCSGTGAVDSADCIVPVMSTTCNCPGGLGTCNPTKTACVCSADSDCMTGACVCAGPGCTGSGTVDVFNCVNKSNALYSCTTGLPNAGGTACLCTNDNQCPTGGCIPVAGQNAAACGTNCTGTGAGDSSNCVPMASTTCYSNTAPYNVCSGAGGAVESCQGAPPPAFGQCSRACTRNSDCTNGETCVGGKCTGCTSAAVCKDHTYPATCVGGAGSTTGQCCYPQAPPNPPIPPNAAHAPDPANCNKDGAHFPQACLQTPLSDQEKALEFMFFDLTACVTPDIYTPAPPGSPVVSQTFELDFPATTCPSGTHPRWTEFDYNVTIPTQGSGSSVSFSAQTGPALDAGSSFIPVPPLLIATVTTTAANGFAFLDTSPGGTGKFTTAVPPIKSDVYLKVFVKMTPTADGLYSPTLVGWQAQYDCPPSE